MKQASSSGLVENHDHNNNNEVYRVRGANLIILSESLEAYPSKQNKFCQWPLHTEICILHRRGSSFDQRFFLSFIYTRFCTFGNVTPE